MTGGQRPKVAASACHWVMLPPYKQRLCAAGQWLNYFKRRVPVRCSFFFRGRSVPLWNNPPMRLLQKPIRELVLFYAVLNVKIIVCSLVPFRLILGSYWSRPYNSPIWSPRYVYLKDKLESVQRRFTKRLKSFGHISYAARLDRLKAETLELRRLKSDLTTMFCVIRGFVDTDYNCLFRVIDRESVHVCGHNLRLYKEHCNVNCRLNVFVCCNITLMSGTGYPLTPWTVTVSQYLSEDWHV